MRTLRQIINETSVEHRGLMMIRIHESFGGFVDGIPMMITAILDNTAVVHPIAKSSPEHRKVVNLDNVRVDENWVEWTKKPFEERRLFRSRQVAHGRSHF